MRAFVGTGVHSLVFAGPLAFLASGCFTRPWTPSVSVLYGADVPDLRSVYLPTSQSVAQAWQLAPTDSWAPYQKLTLVSALDTSVTVGSLPDVRNLDVVVAAGAAGSRVGHRLPARTAWIVDLRGAASVAFGSSLSASAIAPVSCVLTFNNWPADDEMVPAEETLSSLITFSPKAPTAQQNSLPVFLLDAWRLAYRTDEVPDDTMDNRYMLTSADLPDAAALRAQGIDHVTYVVENLDDSAVEEDDLHEIFLAYQAAGIAISIVDLRWLADQAEDGGAIDTTDERYTVEGRVTVVTDFNFYRRAHGGFGGVHGVPSGHAWGGGFSFGHGGSHGGGG
jgi:hypothetical protein